MTTTATIILSLAAALLALLAVLALRSGRIYWYPAFMQVDRAERPRLFWSLVVAQLAAAAALAWSAFSCVLGVPC